MSSYPFLPPSTPASSSTRSRRRLTSAFGSSSPSPSLSVSIFSTPVSAASLASSAISASSPLSFGSLLATPAKFSSPPPKREKLQTVRRPFDHSPSLSAASLAPPTESKFTLSAALHNPLATPLTPSTPSSESSSRCSSSSSSLAVPFPLRDAPAVLSALRSLAPSAGHTFLRHAHLYANSDDRLVFFARDDALVSTGTPWNSVGMSGEGEFSTVHVIEGSREHDKENFPVDTLQAPTRVRRALKRLKLPLKGISALRRHLVELTLLHSLQGFPAFPTVVSLWMDAPSKSLNVEMEYIPYPSLLHSIYSPTIVLSISDSLFALRVGLPLCTALSHVHAANAAHLDVKPANILVDLSSPSSSSPPSSPLKLIDFGCAVTISSDDESSARSGEGDGAYAPLDLFRMESSADALAPLARLRQLQAADVFSVGMSIFQFLLNRAKAVAWTSTEDAQGLPFEPVELPPTGPFWVQLRQSPDDEESSTASLMERLHRFAQHHGAVLTAAEWTSPLAAAMISMLQRDWKARPSAEEADALLQRVTVEIQPDSEAKPAASESE